MPRPPRADEAGVLYHALNRGNLRATILQLHDSLAGLGFRFWFQTGEILYIRFVWAELDGVFALGIDTRVEAAAVRADGVEDFPGGVLDDLNDGVGSVFKHEFHRSPKFDK